MVDFKSVFGPVLPDTVREEAVQWVPQGGSMPSAQDGVYGLGEELLEFTASAGLQGPWKVHTHLLRMPYLVHLCRACSSLSGRGGFRHGDHSLLPGQVLCTL